MNDTSIKRYSRRVCMLKMKKTRIRVHTIVYKANEERITLFTPRKNKIRWKRINW